MNSNSEVKLRQFRDTLELAGKGYIFIGIWNVIKIFMTYTMQQSLMDELISDLKAQELSSKEINATLIFAFAFVALFIIMIHFYIGLGAIKYARKKSVKKGYLVLSVISLVITAGLLPLYFLGADYGGNGVDDKDIASILVDLTMIFIFVDILYSTHMIKKHSATADDKEAIAG